jgi:predicted CXXCH cytochrome family protein
MKGLKLSLMVLMATILALGLSGMAYAFHSGGVAECGGCHSMHSPAATGTFLLVGADQSSACLSCHEHAGDTGPSSYHVSSAAADMPAGTAPLQRTPGGDFGWLKKTYTFVVRGTTNTEEGATHGHNIIAVDKGYTVDSTNATAPGGSFPSAQLGCQSCHDPHGQYRRLSDNTVSKTGAPIIGAGSYDNSAVPAAGQAVGVYRLLAGAGYTKGGVTFNGVPAAKVPSTYNRTEASTQTRVAYGVATSGGHVTWSNWCSTCHPGMHSTGNYVHPVDRDLGSEMATVYAQYVKTGEMTGTLPTSFTSLVPFATNSGDYAALAALAKNDNSQLGGPAPSDQVTCMSCHRAHATGFPDMLRWNMENEFITVNGVYQTQQRGRATLESAAGYYDRPATVFATYQRVLCNKCHAKD